MHHVAEVDDADDTSMSSGEVRTVIHQDVVIVGIAMNDALSQDGCQRFQIALGLLGKPENGGPHFSVRDSARMLANDSQHHRKVPVEIAMASRMIEVGECAIHHTQATPQVEEEAFPIAA